MPRDSLQLVLIHEPGRRVRIVVGCTRTQQIIRILTGIEHDGLAIRNASSCDSVGRLRRKAFPTRNLITVIKEQRHQSQRLKALDSNDLKYHRYESSAVTQRKLRCHQLIKMSFWRNDLFDLALKRISANFRNDE